MKEYLKVLESADLFRGIGPSELEQLLACLSARVSRYGKNRIVFMSGERIHSFGVVLSGQVQIYQEDYYGNKSILAHIGPGQLFAESFAFAESRTLPVSVLATAESELLMIDCRRLAAPCSGACGFHSRLIRNMLGIIARKNVALTEKIELTARRTTREKLLAYLSAQAQAARSGRFRIPYNRQELADYLNVDRSAMSAELSKLRNASVLSYHKNEFELLRTEKDAQDG